MKRHFLTSAVFFFIIAGFFIASPKISHALDPFAVSNITDIKGATYSWVDMAHIQSVVNNNKETFYDPNGVQHYWSNGAGGLLIDLRVQIPARAHTQRYGQMEINQI